MLLITEPNPKQLANAKYNWAGSSKIARKKKKNIQNILPWKIDTEVSSESGKSEMNFTQGMGRGNLEV